MQSVLAKTRASREAIDVSFIEVVKSLRLLNVLTPKHALCFGHRDEAYSNGFEGSRHPDRDRTVIRARGSYFGSSWQLRIDQSALRIVHPASPA
jgi:hypothetical protein